MAYNYLAHHGILGQKWGKRNGPPYPLNESDKSVKEKILTKKPRKQYNKEESEKHGLTDKQKQAIKIGAAATATALATVGTYYLYKSGKLDGLINLGKNKAGSIIDGISDNSSNNFKHLDKTEPLAEMLKKVNPNRGNYKYVNNCSACGIATFLRSIGYDVTAKATGGKPQNLGGVVEECFKGAKVIDGWASKFGRSQQDASEMLLKRFGNNASGVVGIQWKGSIKGHIFNWEIKDGVVSFFDGQNGDNGADISRYWGKINPKGTLTLARLDNAEINFENIKKYVTNR